MKCANCGAKIKTGCVYCSVCGKEAQIVPDYNMEEDYLKSLLQKEENPKKAPKKSEVPKEDKKTPKRQKKGLYIGIVVVILVAVVAFFAGFFAVKSQSFDGRMEKAEKSYAKKDYDKAASYARQALEKDEQSAEAHLMLGKCYYAKGDLEKAKQYLEEAFSISNGNREVCELLIKIYAEEKNYAAITKLSAKVETEELKKLFADYVIEVPEITPEGGVYGEYPEITLSAKDGLDIYYTLDGSNPKTDGIRYEKPFSLEKEGIFKLSAVCLDERGIYSSRAEAEYTVELNIPDLPTASPESGTYTEPVPITIDVPEHCRAYYTWNGMPDANATLYTGPFEMIQGNNVLSVVLVNENGQTSGIQKYNYIYMP